MYVLHRVVPVVLFCCSVLGFHVFICIRIRPKVNSWQRDRTHRLLVWRGPDAALHFDGLVLLTLRHRASHLLIIMSVVPSCIYHAYVRVFVCSFIQALLQMTCAALYSYRLTGGLLEI